MPDSKGHLNPGAPGVELDRFEPDGVLAELVRHVWLARWRLPAGEVAHQRVLAYPTFNLVVMDGAAALYGPDAKLQVRNLSGTGQALGLLLRPAAGRLLLAGASPADLVGRSRPVADAPISEIEAALSQPTPAPIVTALLSRWLGPLAARVDDHGRLVNRICSLAEEDDTIVRVAELARRAGMSARSLERRVVDHIGLTPKWLIECRRLQRAATTLHAYPNTDLTELALSLQYVDYAHFSRRYKEVIGETPDQTRLRAQPRPLQARQ